MGLIVDKPKPGVSNSNDGNTALKFFQDSVRSSEIIGVDQELIERFGVILEAISSCHAINYSKFSQYCQQTAELYVLLYPQFQMPTTVHKILIHGPEIIEEALLPIGMLSEEAQEAQNKHFKKNRESHARKFDKQATLQDVMNSLLVSSDPFITCSGKLPQKKIRILKEEVRELLQKPDIAMDHDHQDEEDLSSHSQDDCTSELSE